MQWRVGKPVIGRNGTVKTAAPSHSPAPTPSRAVYGFLLFLLSNSCLVVYLVWALVPDSILYSLGLHFFPQKYWAVAVPLVLSSLFFVFLFVLYPGLGLLNTPHVHDLRNITDKHLFSPDKHVITAESRGTVKEGGIPPVYDIPIKEVIKHLQLLEQASNKKSV